MPLGFSSGRIPADLTDSYNTALSPEQEVAFQVWRSNLPEHLQSQRDYDLRAAFLQNAQEAGNGHLDDIGKKPNHMTFSDGSVHSAPDMPGGRWVQIAPPSDGSPEGQWRFEASPTNLRAHTADDLLNYFQTAAENGAIRDGQGRVIGYGAPNKVALPASKFGFGR